MDHHVRASFESPLVLYVGSFRLGGMSRIEERDCSSEARPPLSAKGRIISPLAENSSFFQIRLPDETHGSLCEGQNRQGGVHS